MSAYLCDPRHIGGLASFLCNTRSGNSGLGFSESYVDGLLGPANDNDYVPAFDRACRVAVLFAQENLASICYRYPNDSEGDRPGPCGISTDLDYVLLCSQAARRHLTFAVELDPAQILKSCDCFEYQACEHPAWQDSAASKILDQIRKKAVSRMPTYEAAAWGWPEDPRPAIRARLRAESL